MLADDQVRVSACVQLRDLIDEYRQEDEFVGANVDRVTLRSSFLESAVFDWAAKSEISLRPSVEAVIFTDPRQVAKISTAVLRLVGRVADLATSRLLPPI